MNHTIFPRINTSTLSKTRSAFCVGGDMVALILINDNVTYMGYVVKVLVEIFELAKPTAERKMMTAHLTGEALIGLYSRGLAEELTQKLQRMNQINGAGLEVEMLDLSDAEGRHEWNEL